MVYTRPSLKHWVCKDGLPSKSSSVNTGGILEYCVLGPEKGDKCRCREKGLKTLSRWQTKALEIAAFALHVEDCSWGGCSKSQRTSNDSKPFIFSNEIEKPGYFHVWHLERWERKTLYLTMLPAGGAEECVCALQKRRTCTSFLPGLSISWFLLNVMLLPAPSASSGFLNHHCDFLNLTAPAFFAHVIFSVPRRFLFFVFGFFALPQSFRSASFLFCRE